jgi:hypothetical protein
MSQSQSECKTYICSRCKKEKNSTTAYGKKKNGNLYKTCIQCRNRIAELKMSKSKSKPKPKPKTKQKHKSRRRVVNTEYLLERRRYRTSYSTNSYSRSRVTVPPTVTPDQVHPSFIDSKATNNRMECPVCMENEKVIAGECGHLVCGFCSIKIYESSQPKCPICRKQWKKLTKIFI